MLYRIINWGIPLWHDIGPPARDTWWVDQFILLKIYQWLMFVARTHCQIEKARANSIRNTTQKRTSIVYNFICYFFFKKLFHRCMSIDIVNCGTRKKKYTPRASMTNILEWRIKLDKLWQQRHRQMKCVPRSDQSLLNAEGTNQWIFR